MTQYEAQLWLEAVARWVHIFSAILWVGQTFLFHRFERNLARPEAGSSDALGHVWLVHGGGFFRVEKRPYSRELPRPLLWFKWESAVTWLSGAVLLTLMYYHGRLVITDEQDFGKALGIGVGVIVVGWFVYDVLARTPIGRNLPLCGLLGLGAFMGLAYGLRQFMSPRSVYLHIGALTGTLMAANVWVRILPAQSRMLALSQSGGTIDPALAAVGPQRSRHNSYLVLPLIMLMLSNHYPTITYAHNYSWAILGGLLVAGWGAARVLLR